MMKENLMNCERKFLADARDFAEAHDNERNYSARDWTAFFAFLKELGKIIIPLLLKEMQEAQETPKEV
ncbi:hypothetical protein [Polynucleobacter sp.]